MRRKLFPRVLIFLGLGWLGLGRPGDTRVQAQDNPDFHVTVNMVQLNVAVTDKNGNYITGLRPKDFAIVEDGISEKTATFAEGNEPARSLRDLAEEAVHNTIKDAGLDLKEVEAAYVGNSVAGLITGQETIRGQVVLRRTGILGIPIVNVENACASASTAFHLGWVSVAAGLYDCVLALGVEKLSDPDKAKSLRAFNSAVDVSELAEIEKRLGRSSEGTNDRSLFMDLYLSMLNSGASDSQGAVEGITREQMALVSVKNHYHGSLNPYAQYREEVTLEQVLQSRRVVGPLTVLMCSPLGDGAAAVLISAPSSPMRRTGRRVRARDWLRERPSRTACNDPL